MENLKIYALAIVAILFSTSGALGGDKRSDSREIVSQFLLSHVVEKNNCSMITEKDRRAFNEIYEELAEKAENDKLPVICDQAVEDVERSRRQMSEVTARLVCLQDASNPMRCGDTAENATFEFDQLTTSIFGNDSTQEGKIEFALRVCPLGASKLKKALLGLKTAMSLAQFAVPELWMINAGISLTRQAVRIARDGVTPMRIVDASLSVGKRFYSPLSFVTRFKKGFRIVRGFLDREKNHQFVDKLIACSTNLAVQEKREELCTRQETQSDLIFFRDTFLRLADSRINKSAANFCQQTACLWSYGGRRVDKDWRKNTEEKFSRLPNPVSARVDSKGRPVDLEKELHEALEKVEDWRDRCAKISEYVVSCNISCNVRPGQYVPPQAEFSTEAFADEGVQ